MRIPNPPVTLGKLLMTVAQSKGISHKEQWVTDKLSHCLLDVYDNGAIHLRSAHDIPFGIKDNNFLCNSFVLFRQSTDTSGVPTKRVFELYSFNDLDAKVFRDIVEDSYKHSYLNMEDFRIFFKLRPVDFTVKGVLKDEGNKGDKGIKDNQAILGISPPCVLGNFYDFDDFLVNVDLYTLLIYHPEEARPQHLYLSDLDFLEETLLEYRTIDIPIRVIHDGVELHYVIEFLSYGEDENEPFPVDGEGEELTASDVQLMRTVDAFLEAEYGIPTDKGNQELEGNSVGSEGSVGSVGSEEQGKSVDSVELYGSDELTVPAEDSIAGKEKGKTGVLDFPDATLGKVAGFEVPADKPNGRYVVVWVNH